WRVRRHCLAYIPQLNDMITIEAEDMDGGHSSITWLQLHAGVNCHKVPVLKGVLHLKNLVRIAGRILLHSSHERLRVALEEGVVMAKVRADIGVVCLAHLPRTGETQV